MLTITFINLHPAFLEIRIILTRYSRVQRHCKSVSKGQVNEGYVIASSETEVEVNPDFSAVGGLEVACWPLVPKFGGSNPAEAVGFFFRAEKILSTLSFGREGKPFVPCRIFTACKRSLNVTWKSGIFGQNSLAISRPSSSSFHY